MHDVFQLRGRHSTISVVYFTMTSTHNGFTVACSSLLVLAAEEQSVPLLL